MPGGCSRDAPRATLRAGAARSTRLTAVNADRAELRLGPGGGVFPWAARTAAASGFTAVVKHLGDTSLLLRVINAVSGSWWTAPARVA